MFVITKEKLVDGLITLVSCECYYLLKISPDRSWENNVFKSYYFLSISITSLVECHNFAANN